MRIRSLLLALLTAPLVHAQHGLVLDLVLDRYGNETTWQLRDGSNAVIGSGGPYQDFGTNGTYPQPPVSFNDLPDGTYNFTINDSYGDGICCAFGNGSYTLTHVGTGTVIASGGSFGSQESTSFELPPPPPPPVSVTPLTVQLVQVASGFTQVTDLAHAGDDRMFVVQRGGTIRIIDGSGTTLPTPFLSIPVLSTGSEQGLLSLVFHPNYDQNGFLYVNYTSPGIGNSGHSRVSRFTVSADPNVVDASSEVILYTLAQPFSNHNGGDMEFGPDGYLYVGFGDGGSANDPQNFSQNHANALGTMIRIDVDGGSPYAIPPDNPFVGTTDTLPEIWATGLRNPWRFAFDELTGDLYNADVGQNAWEEVNFAEAGAAGLNYGWRCYEASANFNLNGCQPASAYTFPVWEIAHAGSNWCSITGGRVYRGTDFPRLQGMYMFSDFCAGQLRAIRRLDDGSWDTFQLLNSGLGQASTFGTNAQNELFVARLNGFIYRITEACTAGTPTLELQDTVLVSSPGNAYVWTLNGEVIPDATGDTWVPAENGTYQVFVEVNEGCTLASDPLEVVNVGIAELRGDVSLSIHPNPAMDRFTVTGIPTNARGWTAEVRDMTGRLLAGHAAMAVRSPMVVDVARMAPGSFLLVLRDAEGKVRAGERFTVIR